MWGYGVCGVGMGSVGLWGGGLWGHGAWLSLSLWRCCYPFKSVPVPLRPSPLKLRGPFKPSPAPPSTSACRGPFKPSLLMCRGPFKATAVPLSPPLLSNVPRSLKAVPPL